MIFVGIDPGITGAVAVIRGDGSYDVYDTPTYKDGTKRIYAKTKMAEMLLDILHEPGAWPFFQIVLEQVHAMPSDGKVSAFTFGRGVGIWEGIVAATACIEPHCIPPQVWQKKVLPVGGNYPTGKELNRMVAQELFPNAPLSRVRDHNRADALLLAEYGRRTHTTP